MGLEGSSASIPTWSACWRLSFLAARVQLKIDAEFPQFTQHFLEVVYPHYLAPTPSMAIARFLPDATEGALDQGFVIPRDTELCSVLGKGEQTSCEYRTAHPVTLWPIDITEAQYFAGKEPVASLDLPDAHKIRAGIRLRLRTTQPGLPFSKLPLERLTPVFTGERCIADAVV